MPDMPGTRVTGIQSIESLTMDDIDNYKEYLINNNFKCVRRRLGYIKTYLKKSNRDDISYKIENIRQDREIPDILTEQELDKLYDIAKGFPSKRYGKVLQTLYTAMISTLYYSGIRRFEMCNLKINDINFKEGNIRVVKGKGGKSALVPVTEQCLKDIKKYLEYRINVDSDRFFISVMGNPIDPDVVTRIIKTLSAMAGIKKKVTAHTLRRSLGTHLIENGANPYTVKGVLRHSRITTTDLYVNLSLRVLKEGYQDHIKATIGKKPKTRTQRKERTMEDLRDLLVKGEIGEDTYLLLRSELKGEKTEAFYSQAYV